MSRRSLSRPLHFARVVIEDMCLLPHFEQRFTHKRSNLQVGADLVMGSLIKSPGGTLVTGGGYIAGKKELVNQAGARLTAPGVGLDAGAVPGETLRLMFQGKLYSSAV